jgi:hypothetical protein
VAGGSRIIQVCGRLLIYLRRNRIQAEIGESRVFQSTISCKHSAPSASRRGAADGPVAVGGGVRSGCGVRWVWVGRASRVGR